MDKERNVRVRDSECTCYLGELMAAHLLVEQITKSAKDRERMHVCVGCTSPCDHASVNACVRF